MSENNEHVIKKRTIHAGTKAVEFTPNSKVHFHFQTRLCDENKTIIDDSRQMGTGKPIELVLGKKFKLEVWENLIQKLSLNEVASFIVDKSLIESYPFVAKTLRDVHMPIEKRKMTHCCAISIQTEGLGYDDLNKLVKNPQNLEFIFDLIKVEQPDDYKKEIWQMDDNEKLKQIPELKQKGNEHYKNKNLKEASEFYSTAIALLEQLMISVHLGKNLKKMTGIN